MLRRSENPRRRRGVGFGRFAPWVERLRVLVTLAAALVAAPGWAQGSDAGSGGTPPVVSLDKLLTLPGSSTYNIERKAGASAVEWRERFAERRKLLEEEKDTLEKDEEELAEVAGAKSAWKFTAPGMGGAAVGDTTYHYELRTKVQRSRAKVKQLERELRELEVEANLADVPEDWRK